MPGTVDFYSDAAGVEKLIFIASPTPINLNNIPSETVGAFAINNMDDVANAFLAAKQFVFVNQNQMLHQAIHKLG